jgi:hypothetical protein
MAEMVAFMVAAAAELLIIHLRLAELALKASLSSVMPRSFLANFSYSSKVHHGTTNHN